MIEYGLLGKTLAHSYSKRIHNLLADYRYELYPVSPDELRAIMESRAFRGLNVTIPYKRDVMPYCDRLSDEAQAVGNVNTLVFEGGKLVGHNTDIDGFLSMVRRAGIQVANKKALILGSGGTSLTAIAAMRRLNAREWVAVSRSGPVDYAAAKQLHADAEIIINATPVGMYPNAGLSPIDLNDFPRVEGVIDVIYNPFRTSLMLAALERGIPAINGLWMLVAQARRAAELFTGRAIDDSEVQRIHLRLTAELTNLVLIGMPGCGKSAVGRAAAQIMDREMVDADALIEARAGQSVPEIFASRGESGFRALESEVIRELGAGTGRVIATGGGAVMNPDNARALRQNGALVFLKRPLELLAVDGRPLSTGADALCAMYDARRPTYERCADRIVDNTGSIESAASAAVEAFYEIAGD